jgi:hypothetical protein
MRSLRIIIPLFASISIVVASCSSGACFDESIAYVKASMNSVVSGKVKVLAPDSLSLYGPGMDNEKFYDAQKGITRAMLPLNASKDSCRLVMKINNKRDTLTFWYSSYTHLLSKECGYTFFFNIDSIHFTGYTIDSVKIVKKSVTTVLEDNIKIYY